MVARIAGELADVPIENGTQFAWAPRDVAASIDSNRNEAISIARMVEKNYIELEMELNINKKLEKYNLDNWSNLKE